MKKIYLHITSPGGEFAYLSFWVRTKKTDNCSFSAWKAVSYLLKSKAVYFEVWLGSYAETSQ